MNIALATLVLLILLYPGFLFRRFYYTAEFSKEYFKQSITDLIFSSVLPAFIIHIIGYHIFIKGWYDININALGTLLSGSSDAGRVTIAFQNIYNHAARLVWYFLGVSAISMITGLLAKQIVRMTRLDRKSRLFRFQNEWHYVFSGEILDFPNIPGASKTIDCSYVDALVRTDQGTMIYMGLLTHYTLTKDGGIDRIYLSDVKRRYLKDDPENGSFPDEPARRAGNNYYTLPGEFFIIPYSQVLNLHITYYTVDLARQLQQEINTMAAIS